MLLDLHIHSKYSYDSLSDPDRIVKVSVRKGLGAISITDHDTMEAYGGLGHSEGLLVVPGMEVKTDRGDLIGLFLSEEVRSRAFFDVVDEVRRQGGVVTLPHPYRRNCDPAGLAGYVDLVEVINGRSAGPENARACGLCRDAGKKPVAGSDAHTCFEIGRSVTELDGCFCDPDELRKALLRGRRKCRGRPMPYYVAHGCSYLAKRLKGWGWDL